MTDARAESMALLRRRAEERITRVLERTPELDAGEIRALMHELNVHQIELEMQNEQLRQAQQALETSRAQYFDLFNEAPIAYLTARNNGVLLSCNRVGGVLLRIAPESVSRRRIEYFIAASHLHEFRAQRDQLLASGLEESFDLPLRRPDGSTLWATMHLSLAPGEGGEGVSLRIAMVDITHRKQMEQAAARLGAIVTSSDLAILSLDLTGLITSWNGGAERLFGHAEDRMLGQASSVLLPPSRKGEDVLTLSRVTRGAEVGCETMRLRRDETPIPVYLTASPIRDALGRIIGVSQIMRDISEQVASRDNLSLLLEELRRREQALREADRRKDEFIATLAHELRNPLAPIRNAAEVLRQSPGLDSRGQWCRDVIDRQVGQMAALLEDLLDVSRITRNAIALKPERLTIAQAVEQAIETTQPLITARGHRLHVEMLDGGTEVRGDLARLTQVFGNLLNNAAKYTDGEGDLYVTVTRREHDVEVKVRDSGIGIEQEYQSQIFDLFSQVSSTIERSHGGLGIGLFMVRALVGLHGGKVSVWSDGPGAGTEFTVSLPLYHGDEDDGRIERRAVPRSEGLPQLLRILIADDNPDEAATLAMLLRINHYEVTVAQDGEQALAIAETLVPEILLLDIGMPKLNGYEVTREIRRAAWGRDMYIVAYSGWGRPEDRQRSREAGVDVHLSKPVAPTRLLELLASHTRQY